MSTDHLTLQYQENAKVAEVFWEWRYKLMTFVFAASGGLAVVTGWLVDHEASRGLVALPLGISCVLAVAAAGMDRRLGAIMKMTYTTGRELETAMEAGGEARAVCSGIYTRLDGKNQRMSWVLPLVYSIVATGFGVLAVYELVASQPLH